MPDYGMAAYTPFMPSQGTAISTASSGPSLPAPDLGSPDMGNFQRLQSVLGNPGLIRDDPAYQFLRDTGTTALNRQWAGNKMLQSGNAGHAFQDFGEGLAANYAFDKYIPRLMQAADLDLKNWGVQANARTNLYGASRTSSSSSNSANVGSNPGNAGDMAYKDLLARYGSGSGNNTDWSWLQPPGTPGGAGIWGDSGTYIPNYGGYRTPVSNTPSGSTVVPPWWNNTPSPGASAPSTYGGYDPFWRLDSPSTMPPAQTDSGNTGWMDSGGSGWNTDPYVWAGDAGMGSWGDYGDY